MSYQPNSYGGLSAIGVWTKTDISALATTDAEINNAWAGSATVTLAQPAVKVGRLEAMAVKLTGDVGAAGNDLVVTVYKAGVATALTATITGGAGTENEVVVTVTPIAFASGDDITVQAKRVGTPAAVQAIVTVFARLSPVAGAGDSVTMGGDVTGGSASSTVEKIRNKNVPAPGASEDEKFLKYDHDTTAFVFATPSGGSVTMGGDVTGGSGACTVEKIRGKTVDTPAAGDDGQFARYNNGASTVSWEPAYTPGGTDVAIADGGTGQSTATAGFDALAPTTTKGDVIVHDGTDNVRLAVGTNNQVLTADSAQASGVKWAAAGAGSTEKEDSYFRQVGTSPFERWYAAGMITNQAPSTLSVGVGTLRAVPFVTTRAITIDRLGFRVTTAAGSAVARAGIYTATSETNLYPDALVLDGGEQDCSSTGVKAATVSQALSANTLYWFVLLGGTATISVSALPDGGQWAIFGLDNTLGNRSGSWLTVAQAYGALPATFTAGGAVQQATPLPLIACRLSA